jgi:hypothetical protein
VNKLSILPALLLAQPVLAQTSVQPAPDSAAAAASTPAGPAAPKHIAKELASGDGKSKATAFVIYESSEGAGVGKEYEVLRFLGLIPQSQALVNDGKPYDLMTAADPKTGQKTEVWFDISRFFGKM